jgi:hypothetical protein
MSTTLNKPAHEFHNSLSAGNVFENLYYKKVIAPILRSDGYTPVDLRSDLNSQKADVDFGGKIDNVLKKTIEAKFDHVAAVTGNVFLETTSVDRCGELKSSPGCFLISEADEFHQIVILQNKIYISDLKKMRNYWYGDEAVQRIMHKEYCRFLRRGVVVYNRTYESIGDCVSVELLFGENHKHANNYLLDVYEFNEDLLKIFVPLSFDIVNKYHSDKNTESLTSYPEEVLKWLS